MTNTKTNRDVQRQNKASTLVAAVIYSNVVDEGITTIEDIARNMEFIVDVDVLKKAILAISKITKICKDNNGTAISKYCSCSTYIKKGAVSIAHRESRIIKEAIRNKEVYSLSIELRHYNELVVKSYQQIDRINNTYYITPTETQLNESIDMDSSSDHTSIINVESHLSETIVTSPPNTIPINLTVKSKPKKKKTRL